MDDEEALRRLERRLDQASETAQRLVGEAAEAALRAGSAPPAAGWETPPAEEPARGDQLEHLLTAVKMLRDLIPPELQRKLADALRELLLAVRALIDWYIERLGRREEASSEVEDIPIL
jgi:hypothetical protein